MYSVERYNFLSCTTTRMSSFKHRNMHLSKVCIDHAGLPNGWSPERCNRPILANPVLLVLLCYVPLLVTNFVPRVLCA